MKGELMESMTVRKDEFPSPDDDSEDDDRVSIPCCRCGRATTFDPIYGDLCYRCCRCDSE